MTRVLNKDRLPRMLRILDADGLDKELSRTVASQEAAHTLLVKVIRSDSLIQGAQTQNFRGKRAAF
jgi:hypothetical protein